MTYSKRYQNRKMIIPFEFEISILSFFFHIPLSYFSLAVRDCTRQVSSMIHSARPTVSPVANIVFALFCFARFCKVGTDGRTKCAKTMIPTGRDLGWSCGSILEHTGGRGDVTLLAVREKK